MVAYSFHKRFIEPIRAGFKTQTIRAQRDRHARPGERIGLYWGMRTAQCTKIIPDPRCTAIMAVELWFGPARDIIRITTDEVPVRDIDAFAQRDGFTDAEDMAAFWATNHGLVCCFTGVLIEWTAPRTDRPGDPAIAA